TLAQLQVQVDVFRYIYDHQRPHRGLNRRTPADTCHHAPTDRPAHHPSNTPTRTHRSTTSNRIVWAGNPYPTTTETRYNHQPAPPVITGTARPVFVHRKLVRQLTITPTPRHQPPHNRPGRPPTHREG